MEDTTTTDQQQQQSQTIFLNPEELAKLEYEALRAEERDRMNARLTVWGLYLTIVSVFGFASIQAGTTLYVIGLCPFLLACLARYTRHSEDVLRVTRKYLYKVEQASQVQGYEHFTRSMTRASHGGHVTSLRDAFLLTDLLASVMIIARLVQDHVVFHLATVVFPVALPVSLAEGTAIIFTYRWLRR
jgi:hypothetical protein